MVWVVVHLVPACCCQHVAMHLHRSSPVTASSCFSSTCSENLGEGRAQEGAGRAGSGVTQPAERMHHDHNW